MKTIIWGAFGVLALLWTGGVALVAELLQWSAGALASGGVTGRAEAAARVPVPTRLAPFVDLAGWREILSSVAIALESLSTILPPLGESLG